MKSNLAIQGRIERMNTTWKEQSAKKVQIGIGYGVQWYVYNPFDDTQEFASLMPSHFTDGYWKRKIGNEKGSLLT